MVLTGAAPGAMSSNVMCYIAKADTAYAVSMTTATTLLCPVLTPAITLFLSGKEVPIHFGKCSQILCGWTIIPLFIGFAVRYFFSKQVEKYRLFSPPFQPPSSCLSAQLLSLQINTRFNQ